MKEKKKAYTLHYECVEDRSVEITKSLARNAINKVLKKHGVVAYNLEEVLDKYITKQEQTRDISTS
ncbi:hypothetical protein D3C87_1042790 [compost metagenome]